MKAYCLCLDKRKEHWTELAEQAKLLNIDFTPFIVGDGKTLPNYEYDYIDDANADISNWGYGNPKYKINHYNAFMAHKRIINQAKKSNLEYFLMLEDDCYFTSRYLDIFNKICDEQPIFNMLYLGWWIGDENDDWNKNIEEEYKIHKKYGLMRINRLGGLHGAIIHKSMYDYILSLPPIDPIDSQLNQIHHKIYSYIVFPKIIHIKSIHSYCEGVTINRNLI